MSLAYKNKSVDTILNINRSSKYYSSNMIYSFDNVLNITLNCILDPTHIAIQADVFARMIISMRSDFDFKRFLGPDVSMWMKQLHLVYVYLRLKGVFYGLVQNYTFDWPKDTYNFPGNILLAIFLKERTYQFHTDDAQPFSLYVNIETEKNFATMAEPIFKAYPELKEGLSESNNNYVYLNYHYETIVRGLFNGKEYIRSRKGGNVVNNIYELYLYNDENIHKFTKRDSNPILNSSLSNLGSNFNFIQPSPNTEPGTLRFNESLFLPRAIGLFNNATPKVNGNSIYLTVDRNILDDPFTKDDIYAITGMKTDIVPYPVTEMLLYLNLWLENGELVKKEVERGEPF